MTDLKGRKIDLKKGKRKKASTPTIASLIPIYRLNNRAEGKSPKTIDWYDQMLAAYCGYIKDKNLSLDLSFFTMDSVRNYILYLREKPKFKNHPYIPEQKQPVSPKTIQCHVRVLKAFSSWLYWEGHTKENRLGNLKLPKAPVTLVSPLTEDEVREVISAIDKKSPTGFRNYAIVSLFLDSGLRASELANITLTHLNLKDGFIKVMGKGAKERIVPIGKFVQMILWRYTDSGRPIPSNGGNRLFLSRDSKPISVNCLKLMFTKLAKNSGVERLHCHLCRHTFAVNYILNGGDIYSLREILGHTTFEMVNQYLHFTNSQITAQHHKYSPMDKLQLNKGLNLEVTAAK